MKYINKKQKNITREALWILANFSERVNFIAIFKHSQILLNKTEIIFQKKKMINFKIVQSIVIKLFIHIIIMTELFLNFNLILIKFYNKKKGDLKQWLILRIKILFKVHLGNLMKEKINLIVFILEKCQF